MAYVDIKSLLVVTAVLELGAGLALLVAPSWIANLLLGAGLDSPASIVVARIGGAALLSIGVSCWLERSGQRSGLVAGLLVYNAAVAALLIYGALVDKVNGVGTWPACGLHMVMSIWCAARLRTNGSANNQ